MKSSSRPNVDAVKGRHGSIPTYCKQCGQTHKPKECPAHGLKCSVCKKLHCFPAMRNPYQGRSTAQDQRTPRKSDCELSN